MRVTPKVLVVATVLACVASPLVAIEPALQPDAPVRLDKLFLIDSSLGPMRSVAFTFDFPGRDSVTIKGLGTVPARGSFRYLTPFDRLEFLEPATGRTLFELPLTDPQQLMNRYSVTLPAQNDFPQAFRTGRWDGAGSFHVHLADVLNRHFPSGFVVLQVNQANALLTTYRALDGVSEPLFGRVAVLIEPPADHPPGAPFRVRFTTQERRSRTGWQNLSSQEVRAAVERYITGFVRELEGPRH
jgi:hypothetical protein